MYFGGIAAEGRDVLSMVDVVLHLLIIIIIVRIASGFTAHVGRQNYCICGQHVCAYYNGTGILVRG